MPDSATPLVFISYSSADKLWTDAFASALHDKGIDIWYDRSSLRPGDRWQEQLQQALRDSRVFCVVVGADEASTPQAYFEIGAALADDKIIVPVLATDARAARVPPLLSRYKAIDAATPGEAAACLAQVVEHVE